MNSRSTAKQPVLVTCNKPESQIKNRQKAFMMTFGTACARLGLLGLLLTDYAAGIKCGTKSPLDFVIMLEDLDELFPFDNKESFAKPEFKESNIDCDYQCLVRQPRASHAQQRLQQSLSEHVVKLQ